MRAVTEVRDDDAGSTLVELVVTMVLMTVVMVVFTGAIVQIYRATLRTETSSTASAQVRQAFQRLDKVIRYASWIATPGKVGTSWYVEFAAGDPTAALGCGQLRLDNRGVLQLLQWTAGSPPTAGQAGQTLASQLVYDSVVSPFVMQSAGTTASGAGFAVDYQRLQVRLTSTSNQVSTTLDSTFTALNTSRSTVATNTCSEGRP